MDAIKAIVQKIIELLNQILAKANESQAPVVTKPDPVKPEPVKPAGSSFTRAKLALIAEQYGVKNIKEGTPEHKQIIADFIPMFGNGTWAWCGAFVYDMCKLSGLNIPLKCPSKYGFTFAFVEGWQQWGIEKGMYYDNDGVFKPQAGDITIFDWNQKDINEPDKNQDSHVGVHLRMDGALYVSAEGNTSDMTAIRKRPSVNIQGWIRIPDGYKF